MKTRDPVAVLPGHTDRVFVLCVADGEMDTSPFLLSGSKDKTIMVLACACSLFEVEKSNFQNKNLKQNCVCL